MATSIGIRYLKAQAGELIRRVEAGEEFVVTRRGKPCAKLVPATPASSVDSEAQVPLKGRFRDWPDLSWEDFQEAKRILEPRPLPSE